MRRRRFRHPVLISIFVLALIASIFFALTFVWQLSSLSRSSEHEIRPWMTLSYVARSIGLPVDDLDSAMGLQRNQERGTTLTQIARDLGVSVDEVIAHIEAAITALTNPDPDDEDEKAVDPPATKDQAAP